MVQQQPSKKLEKEEEQKAKAAAAKVQAKAKPKGKAKASAKAEKQRRVEKHVRGVTLVHPTLLRTVVSPNLRHLRMNSHLLPDTQIGGYSFREPIHS